jgi:hypothetical protein
MMASAYTGPHPHPATHVSIPAWLAGWGYGPVQAERKRVMLP